jgi:hypothetical protein
VAVWWQRRGRRRNFLYVLIANRYPARSNNYCNMSNMNGASKLLPLRSLGLPRGLWVGKLGRPGRVKRDLDLVPARKRPWDLWPEDYFPDYYFRLVKKGEKVIQRCTQTQDFKVALKRAKVEWELWSRRKWDKRAAALIDTPVKVPTAGEVFAAYLAVMENKRPVQSARLIYALSQGLVKKKEDRDSREGTIRERSDLAAEIDAVPSDVFFSGKTVRAYFTARQGGKYDPISRAREHLAYNKTLRFARELFTEKAMRLCYGELELPDLSEFRKFPCLAQATIDPREKAIAPEAWAKMQKAAKEWELAGDPEQQEIAFAN